jgi:hypothetical protein
MRPSEILKLESENEAKASVKFGVLNSDGQEVGFATPIVDIMANVSENHLTHYWTDGAWSMHQLLTGLLHLIGESDVLISTYALSETSVRTMDKLKESGYIKSLNCVIDNRVDTRSAASFQFFKALANKVVLADCHAKVTILIGKSRSLIVIGSANYTENKRMEVGIISDDAASCNFHKEWIENLLNNGTD